MQRELESARLTVVPWDTPFEILKGTYTRHRFAPHLHETFGLGAIEAGASKIRYRDRTVTQRAGDVVVIPAREVHTGESDGPQGWSYRMLYLPEDLLAAFTTSDDLTFDGPSIEDPELARRIIELHALLDAGTDRLRLGVDQDGAVVVELDVAAVGAPALLGGAHDDRLDDVALLDVAAGDGVLDGGDDDVTDAGVPTT